MASTAFGQSTGISDNRVSLPEGPGSLEGVGENVGMNPNMGSMSYSVPIKVNQGFAGVTPQLGLSYNSGGGGSVVGMGWTMELPYIERMTYRGLPEYDRDDDFSSEGSNQLVRIPGSEPPVYRSRYEKGFMRYTWMQADTGDEGYWIGEWPDGRVGYFGADFEGNTVTNARVSGGEGTFRYHLVEMRDVFGHRITYEYGKYGNPSLIERIGYVYTANPNQPRYSVTFAYQEREDADAFDYLSDAKAGFDVLLMHRLASVNVFSGAERVRRYELGYEGYEDSGGFTRLVQVKTVGHQGDAYPIRFDFEYSKALGGVCGEAECDEPFVVDMGSIGIGLNTGRVTLLDINGDALPDALHTPTTGSHQFFLNQPDPQSQTTFNTTAVTSSVGDNSHVLGTAFAQVVDVNGDGFTDLLNLQDGEVLINRGSGDWDERQVLANTGELPDFGSDFQNGSLQSIRFLDIDNDKQIDLLRSTGSGTTVYKNAGMGRYEVFDEAEAVEIDFGLNRIELTDMNGDGLLDIAVLLTNRLQYKLNLGRGKWSDLRSVNNIQLSELERSVATLEDLNGDGLADLVIVSGSQVRYAINRNGSEFINFPSLTSSDVNGTIPTRTPQTAVLYADMNGNGSFDVVWVTPQGQFTYLELFPVRPNLMSKITNNIGMVTEIKYGTSVEHMARDGGTDAWAHKLPHPMLVVDEVDKYDLLTNIHDITQYTYHDGFYDGKEKQFRGYARVETHLLGDDSLEEGLTEAMYDVGATDPYFNGLMLSQRVSSAERLLNQQTTTYDECEVDEVPSPAAMERDGLLPVRFICQVATEFIEIEGTDEEDWVTIESNSEYDGYGNVVTSSNLGVTAIGDGGCEPCNGRDPSVFGRPCGPQCLGDEMFSETEYVQPGDDTSDRWIVGAAFRQRSYGRQGSDQMKETLTYYDGPDFEGMNLGTLDEGKATRVTVKVEASSNRVIETTRNKYDDHGNVIETLDPLGEEDGTTHRRAYEYDDEQLRVVQTDIFLENPDGEPYSLRRRTRYEDLFDKVIENTQWMRVVDGDALSAPRSSFLAYDQFARPIARVRPGGDTLQSPTEAYQYDLASPVSRIIVNTRSQIGGPLDLELIQCIDGRGRQAQSRTRLEQGSYQVTGLRLYNVKNLPHTVYQPYVSNSDACDTTPPDGTLATRYRYDGTYRQREAIAPDEGIYGEASVTRTQYSPLTTLSFDGEDTDPNSAHHNTPTIRHMDGLGRLVAIDRLLAPNQAHTLEVRYDELGRVRGFVDPQGNEKIQHYDLLDRMVRLSDPNTQGEDLYAYDDASNVVSMTDSRGITTLTDYDGNNRPVARWDDADREGTRIAFVYDTASDCSSADCTNTEGQLVQTSYPGLESGTRAIDRIGYDARNRPIYSARQLEGYWYENRTAYDNADRIISTTYPDGQVVERNYDDASRLQGIEGFVSTVAYDDRSLVAEARCADGTRSRWAYDDLMRLESMQTDASNGQTLQNFVYSRDRVGNILELGDEAEDAVDRPRFGALYNYDAWYRLLEADMAGGNNIENEVLSYEYDAIDNITAINSSLSTSKAHRGSMAYDGFGPNSVSQVGELAFGYDAGGYTASRGDLSMQWDFMGRMTEATRGGESVGRFVYGSNQSRVLKNENDSTTHYIGRDFETRDGITTLYIKMGRRRMARVRNDDLATALLSDVNEDGAITVEDARLVHNGEEGSSPERLLWSSVRRQLMESEAETVYLHHDHLGSIILATDGDALGHRSYYPLGLERDSFGYIEEHGFTGQELDQSTGLVHFDWRYLDPQSGRWLSIDPAFQRTTAKNITRVGESSTSYAYVANNPANAYDPTGLMFQPAAMRVGTILGKASLPYLQRAYAKIGGLVGSALGVIGAFRPDLKTIQDTVGIAKDTVGIAKDTVGIVKDTMGIAKDIGRVSTVSKIAKYKNTIAGIVGIGVVAFVAYKYRSQLSQIKNAMLAPFRSRNSSNGSGSPRPRPRRRATR